MGLKYFPKIDEPHMERTQKKNRFAYLFDLDEEAPKQKPSKSASNESSAEPRNSDSAAHRSTKARSPIIKSTINLVKRSLKALKPAEPGEANQKSDQEFVKLSGSGGPWTSTEILQDKSRRFSHEYSPPGGELKRSKAMRLRPSTAHLKKRRASLNQKLARREWEYQYMSRQTMVTVWP